MASASKMARLITVYCVFRDEAYVLALVSIISFLMSRVFRGTILAHIGVYVFISSATFTATLFACIITIRVSLSGIYFRRICHNLDVDLFHTIYGKYTQILNRSLLVSFFAGCLGLLALQRIDSGRLESILWYCYQACFCSIGFSFFSMVASLVLVWRRWRCEKVLGS